MTQSKPPDEPLSASDRRTITFLASLPPIQSAISLAGDGGARIKLDVSEDQMGAVMWLATLRGQVFRVTIGPGE